MSTPTTAITPAVQPTAQGTHLYVLSLFIHGYADTTLHGTITPAPGATRRDIFNQLRENAARNDKRWLKALVVFFSLEPNQL